MRGYSVGLRVQVDALDDEDLIRRFTDLFKNKRADWIADWEVDWEATSETKPNWDED